MADEPREIELKFRLDPARADAVFDALGRGRSKTHAMTSIYYDTPGKTLSRAGMALRVRREDERWIQTLKTASAGDGHMGRGEWEAEVAGATPNLDLLADTPAAARLAKSRSVTALFTVKVERRVRVVRQGETEIELSLDRGEVAADGRVSPLVELELELKRGTTAALLEFAVRVRKTQGLALSFETKAARGMALLSRTGGRAVRFRIPALTPDMTTAGAFKAIARACLEQIVGNAERLADAPGPEVVHQMRVGVRRLRSTISTFASVVDDRRLPAIKAELKWLTGELDAARNLDVMLSGAWRRAAQAKTDRTGLAALGKSLRLARGAAYARARSAAESERMADLVMDTLVWIEAGAWTTGAGQAGGGDLGTFAARALEKGRGKVVEGGRGLAGLSREERHHVRIDAKKLRYAAEVFADVSGHPKRARRFLEALRDLQEGLGELNDIATAEVVAHDMIALPTVPAEADWAVGRIIGEEAAREPELIRAAKSALKALRKADAFWR